MTLNDFLSMSLYVSLCLYMTLIMSGSNLAEIPAFEQLTDLQLFIFADVSVDNPQSREDIDFRI